MDRNQAFKLCKEELLKHGLAHIPRQDSDWGVRLNTTLDGKFANILGLCSYKDRVIIINAHHIDIHPEQFVVDTIKHEVAHAIVGSGHGHDSVWRDKAKEIGSNALGPCSHLSLTPEAIEAIRSGATLEVELVEETILRPITTYEEEKVTKPKYTVTRLQERCPFCGKVAEELRRVKSYNKQGDEVEMITLKCFHIITKTIPRATPFQNMVSNYWKPEIKACSHIWGDNSQRNKCIKCGEFKLYDFQIEGARFIERALASHKGAGIFDEMGLGKTVQALAYLRYHKEAHPTLFIVKSGITFQWFKEIIRWLGPDHLGQIIKTGKDYVFPNLKTYIISYDLLRRFPREKIQALGIKTVILDECQQIKNVDSTRTQEVRKIVGDPSIKVIPLSGTPWKNRGSEFFPVLNMLDPFKFNSEMGYLKTWVQYFMHGNRRKEGGIRNPKKFKEYISDIVIRRERTEVMKELPLINRTKLNVKLDDLQQDEYDDSVSDFVKWYNQVIIDGLEESVNGMEILAKMSRMRHLTGLAKIGATLEYVKEFIEDTDRKLVIFHHHIDVGQILYDTLKKEHGDDIYIARITGGMDPGDRFTIQEKFNESPRGILVASSLAAGEGLNLQTCADCVMHERQWNPANEEQCEGRFIRIGSVAAEVNATYAESEGTIDEHFDVIVETKRLYFHEAMSKGKMPEWDTNEIAKSLANKIVAQYREKNKKADKPTTMAAAILETENRIRKERSA